MSKVLLKIKMKSVCVEGVMTRINWDFDLQLLKSVSSQIIFSLFIYFS